LLFWIGIYLKRKEGLNSAEWKAKWSELANCKAGDYLPNEQKSATPHFSPKNNTLWYFHKEQFVRRCSFKGTQA
jgi:hypothetical protein